MKGWGLFFLLLFLLLIIAIASWVGYSFYRTRKAGVAPPRLTSWRTYVPFLSRPASTTNYPTPRSSGPLEWFRDQFDKLRNKRTARGAYEETSAEGASSGGYRAGGRGGRGLEDDAWDTRVGGEEDQYRYAGYEEQELGLAPAPGLQAEPYGGAAGYEGRGRGGPDPFGDQHEAESLRSVSPRPHEGGHTRGQPSVESAGSGEPTSPTGTRKSAFREGI